MLRLRCDQARKVTVTGKIVAPGRDPSLKKATRRLSAGKSATIKLKLSAQALSAVRRAWRRHHTPTAKLQIVAGNAAGKATKKSPRIALAP